jgi:hypothetical protein
MTRKASSSVNSAMNMYLNGGEQTRTQGLDELKEDWRFQEGQVYTVSRYNDGHDVVENAIVDSCSNTQLAHGMLNGKEPK